MLFLPPVPAPRGSQGNREAGHTRSLPSFTATRPFQGSGAVQCPGDGSGGRRPGHRLVQEEEAVGKATHRVTGQERPALNNNNSSSNKTSTILTFYGAQELY